MKKSPGARRALCSIASLILMTLISACSKGEATAPPVVIAAGDNVVLNKHALACKASSTDLGLVATSDGPGRGEILARIGKQEGCHDSAAFLVNDQWQVLAVDGTQLQIRRPDYVGEYWVSVAQVSPGTARAVAGPPIAPVTVAEWRKALSAAYEESQVQKEKDEDGVITFIAKYPKKENAKGVLIAFGKHDAFNKTYTFKPIPTQLEWNLGPTARCYVVVSEGAMPFVIVSPLYWGRDGYISLRKIAILLDGDLLYEKSFDSGDIQRGHYGVGVSETASIVLAGDELLPFRKIASSSKIAIRLTGDKGYVNLTKGTLDPLKTFKDSLIDSLDIYDHINKTTADHLVPKVAAKL